MLSLKNNNNEGSISFEPREHSNVINIEQLDMFLSADFGRFRIDEAEEEIMYRIPVKKKTGVRIIGQGYAYGHVHFNKVTKQNEVRPEFAHFYESKPDLGSVPIAAPIDHDGNLADLLNPLKRRIDDLYNLSQMPPQPEIPKTRTILKLKPRKVHPSAFKTKFTLPASPPPPILEDNLLEDSRSVASTDSVASTTSTMSSLCSQCHKSELVTKFLIDRDVIVRSRIMHGIVPRSKPKTPFQRSIQQVVIPGGLKPVPKPVVPLFLEPNQNDTPALVQIPNDLQEEVEPIPFVKLPSVFNDSDSEEETEANPHGLLRWCASFVNGIVQLVDPLQFSSDVYELEFEW